MAKLKNSPVRARGGSPSDLFSGALGSLGWGPARGTNAVDGERGRSKNGRSGRRPFANWRNGGPKCVESWFWVVREAGPLYRAQVMGLDGPRL